MRVDLIQTALKLSRPVMTGRGAIARRDGVLVRIAAGGLTGWGEAMPLPGWPGADLSATRIALERWAAEPNPEELPGERFAHGAVELALLDLEARRAGKTQAQVLAGEAAPAGSVEINALVSDAPAAAAAMAAGFRTVKLKVGASDLESDVALVASVRRAIGADARLRLDANGAWTAGQAAESLGRLEQYDIEHVEEPVAGIESLAQLAPLSPIPLAVDESLGSVDTRIPESISVVVLKPMALGGPRTAYTAACRWIARGRKVVVTNFFDAAVGQHAALSVAAALPGPPQAHGAITPDLYAQDIAELPLLAGGRCVLPSQSPAPTGFGLEG